MNKVETFFFENLTAVRVIKIDGEPWFVLSDLAKALGYRDAEKAKRHLRDSQYNTPDRGISRELGFRVGKLPTLVTESGVYRLIMRSEAKNAEAFQDWVTDVVLPEIRRDGTYIPPGLNKWEQARAQGKLAHRSFTDALKEIYEASNTSTPYEHWVANFTKMIYKQELGWTEQEYKERKAAGKGNAREAMSADELRRVEGAELTIVGLALRGSYSEIRELYHGAKELLANLPASV